MSILRHVDVTAEERAAYLKRASAIRRGSGAEARSRAPKRRRRRPPTNGGIELGEQRYVELSAAEQFVLTLSERGYGKRSSSLRVPHHRRGGKGIVAMVAGPRAKTGQDRSARSRSRRADQVMLVTDAGQADPHAGRRHPHRRALDARRDRAQHRRRRARGVGRAAERGRGRVVCHSGATTGSRGARPVVTRERPGIIIPLLRSTIPARGRRRAPDDEHEHHLFSAFLLITVVLFLTPGPIVTLIIATGARQGTRAALLTVAGAIGRQCGAGRAASRSGSAGS